MLTVGQNNFGNKIPFLPKYYEFVIPLGYENEAFEDAMNCMIEGSCISNYPKDGYCVADNEDGDKSLTDLKQLEGDWWVIRGKNQND